MKILAIAAPLFLLKALTYHNDLPVSGSYAEPANVLILADTSKLKNVALPEVAVRGIKSVQFIVSAA